MIRKFIYHLTYTVMSEDKEILNFCENISKNINKEELIDKINTAKKCIDGYNNLVGITLYKYKDIQLCTIDVHSDSNIYLFCEKVLSILTYKED